MEWIILTGMSGAGKTKALNTLEDVGFYCVDNLPPRLLPALADLRRGSTTPTTVVVDARSYGGLVELTDALGQLGVKGVAYRILFLDADNAALMRRYKETRRGHPMASPSDESIADAISRERAALRPLFERADYRIDTSNILPSQLKTRLTALLAGAGVTRGMWIHCTSFGFKYGMPADADIVFDVRCLPNPFYVEALNPLSGLDEPIERYVMGFDSSRRLLDSLRDLMRISAALYQEEGRAQLTIAIGCTGGRHRSVLFAKELGEFLETLGYTASISHRDIDRG